MSGKIGVAKAEVADAGFFASLDVAATEHTDPDLYQRNRRYWQDRIGRGEDPIYIASIVGHGARIGYLALIGPPHDDWEANYRVSSLYDENTVLDALLTRAGVERREVIHTETLPVATQSEVLVSP